jgi:hypothetical protein
MMPSELGAHGSLGEGFAHDGYEVAPLSQKLMVILSTGQGTRSGE